MELVSLHLIGLHGKELISSELEKMVKKFHGKQKHRGEVVSWFHGGKANWDKTSFNMEMNSLVKMPSNIIKDGKRGILGIFHCEMTAIMPTLYLRGQRMVFLVICFIFLLLILVLSINNITDLFC